MEVKPSGTEVEVKCYTQEGARADEEDAAMYVRDGTGECRMALNAALPGVSHRFSEVCNAEGLSIHVCCLSSNDN